MGLRRLALLFLLPAWLVLGPGWNVRFCARAMLDGGCCGLAASACCPQEKPEPRTPAADDRGCDTCCIDVHTPPGQPVTVSQQQLSDEFARGQLVALELPVWSSAARRPEPASPPPDRAPAAPRGRSSPLPLRL